MSARELLELAAKAAGMDGYYWYQGSQSLTIGADWGMDSKRGSAWNPLVNDGDALRLAVKLRIQIPVIGGGMFSDPLAETRLRIVRAAAEIGRTAQP